MRRCHDLCLTLRPHCLTADNFFRMGSSHAVLLLGMLLLLLLVVVVVLSEVFEYQILKISIYLQIYFTFQLAP